VHDEHLGREGRKINVAAYSKATRQP
jgi:hypothetical protein